MTVVPDASQPAPAHQAWTGARDIAPLALGVAIYGLAYGLLAAQAGFTPSQTGIMGAVVFAGGCQIIASQQLVAGAGALAAIIAGLALNLRLLLVTASIRDVYAARPWWQVALGAHLATDENWAMMLAQRAKGHPIGFWYLVGGGLSLITVWCLATTIGISFARTIPDPKALGMDFAFTAAFIAIARSLWKGRGDVVPWLTAIAVVTASVRLVGLPPSWALIVGGIAGAATKAATGRD